MKLRRRAPWLTALLLLAVLFLIIQNRGVLQVQRHDGHDDLASELNLTESGLPPRVPLDDSLARLGQTKSGNYSKNVHTLEHADLFIPHFETVTRLPGLSIFEAKSACTWPSAKKVNFQYPVDVEWVVEDRGDDEIDSRRDEWHNYVKEGMIPYSQVADRFTGRGIVIVAGNADTLQRVKVLLRALLQLGTKLPVEIHYWADELKEADRSDLQSVYANLYFNDLSSKSNIFASHGPGLLMGYHLKTAAIMNSRFAEVLLLDSDNVPVIDPQSLFDCATYKEYGTIFWPDIARTRPQNPIWAITNTPCKMDEYEQESGQVLVDKRRFFYHIQLAAWFNHQSYYNDFLLGDKDTFRFAWHALKTTYGRPRRWLTSVGVAQPDGAYCGHSFAQHHPNGSIAFVHGGLLKTIGSDVIKYNHEHGGFFRSYKTSPDDVNMRLIVGVGIYWDDGKYLPSRKASQVASCTDMFEIPPRSLEEILPGFEEKFERAGGFWMLNSSTPDT